MGKPTLVWSHTQLYLANQYWIFPIGRLADIEVNINRVKSVVEFKVIIIVDDTYPYQSLFGIN